MAGDPNKWCRRVFASVDVVGSTGFKQRNSHDSGRWANVFKQFFDEFPVKLRAKFQELEVIAGGKPASPFQVWKFVGDEILFTVEILRHEEVAFHALAFMRAINQYTEELKKKPELSPLVLKGTLWGAGFPVRNVEVTTRVGDGDNTLTDYIGPCVDQGFRLCSLANNRQIPVSLDVAYMLSATTFVGRPRLMMQCEKPKAHRGFTEPYPHVWIDRHDGPITEEDKIFGRRLPKEPSHFKSYFEEIYDRQLPDLPKPFLINDSSELFKNVPDKIAKARETLLHFAAEQSYKPGDEPIGADPLEKPPLPMLPPNTTN